MIYINAFLFCGLLCLIGQLLLDLFKVTPGHITSLFVVIGSILNINGVYDYFVKKCGAGALLPITSFGHSLTHAAISGVNKNGLLGLFSSVFDLTTTGIVATIVFGFISTILFKAKD